MTSQEVERTWIHTGSYGRLRGEWVNKIVVIVVVNYFLHVERKCGLHTKQNQKNTCQMKNTSGGSGADTIFYSLDCAVIKVFSYSFWETIPMFFNHLKSNFILVQSLQNFHQ